MSACAYLLSYTHQISSETGGVFHSLGRKVRSRFTRSLKPTDHLGGLNPDELLLVRVDYVKFNSPQFDEDRDTNIWPKSGSTHEDMEISIG
jgi:hypothetical protein